MGGGNGRPAEALRRLGGMGALARHRLDDPAALVHPLQRVDHRHGGKDAVGGVEAGDRAVDHAGGDEGTGGVVDEDAVGGDPGERLEAAVDRDLASRSAVNGSKEPRVVGEACERLGIEVGVLRRDRHDHGVDRRMVEEGGDGAGEDGHAGDRSILFRQGIGAGGTAAGAGGDDQDGGRGLHGTEGSEWRFGRWKGLGRDGMTLFKRASRRRHACQYTISVNPEANAPENFHPGSCSPSIFCHLCGQ